MIMHQMAEVCNGSGNGALNLTDLLDANTNCWEEQEREKNWAFPISASSIMKEHSYDSGSALPASVVDGNPCDGDGGEEMAMVEVEEDDEDDGRIGYMNDLRQ